MLKFTTESTRVYLNGQLYAYALTEWKARALADAMNLALATKRSQSALERVEALKLQSHKFDRYRRWPIHGQASA